MPRRSQGPVPVLLVEDRADRGHGHYAPFIRQLADGFTALGHPVTVLTSVGLHPDGLGPPTWSIRRYGPVGQGVERLLRRIDRASPGGLGGPRPGSARRRGAIVRATSLLVLVESRLAARALGPPGHVAVIISRGLPPSHVALAAPVSGHWALWCHAAAPPHVAPPGRARALLSRWAEDLVAARLRARSARGGRLVLVGSHPDLTRSWIRRLPALPTGTVGLPVARVEPNDDPARAHRQLGLPTGGRLALFFGAMHPGKAPDAVWSAWCEGTPPPALLVAAGLGVAADFEAWTAQHPGADATVPHLIDGEIDEETRRLLFDAADLGVLSFRPEWSGASATLTDFAARAVPVCCSSGGASAELVGAYGLGEVFAAGDPADLARAVARAGARPEPTGLEAFLADHGEGAVAQAVLDLLFPPSP